MCIVGDVNMTATEPLGCSAVKVGEAVVETSNGGLGDRRIPGPSFRMPKNMKYIKCQRRVNRLLDYSAIQNINILPF